MKNHRTAIFTIVQNDSTFTKRWVDYHGQYFDDVYILDHDSVGDAAELLEQLGGTAGREHVSVIPVHHLYSYDAEWMAQTVRLFHSFLIQSYRMVAFTCVDEFLVPAQGSLAEWLEMFSTSEAWAARATGYELIHRKEHEPPLDWAADRWLAQRRTWYPSHTYSKPVIGKQPIFWSPGFSDASNIPAGASSSLHLIHLHRIDYDECLRKHREARSREWLPFAKNVGPFRQNRLEEPEALSRWMLCNSDSSREYATLEEIPETIKGLL
jgi:hypothetical protein